MYQKSRSVRRHYAFWYAVGATAVIALIWVVSLQYRLDDTEEIVDDTQRGAFAAFWEETAASFSDIFPENESAATTTATSTNSAEGDNNQGITEFLNAAQQSEATTTQQRRSIRIETISSSSTTATNTGQ